MGIYRDTLANPYTPDFGGAVARGEIPGYSYEHKFGYGVTAGSNTQTIWTGTNSIYVFPGSATYMKLTSTVSADDTSTVIVSGLNSAYTLINEEMTIIGGGVTTSTNLFSRVHRIEVTSASDGVSNQGQLYVGNGTITTQVPANIFAHVASDNNQTLQAIYTVPASTTAYIYDMLFSVSQAKTATVELLAREPGGVFQCKRHFDLYQQAIQRKFTIPLKFTEKTDINFIATGTAAANTVTAEFDMMLVNN